MRDEPKIFDDPRPCELLKELEAYIKERDWKKPDTSPYKNNDAQFVR